ncbi:uncharacterized protein LOC128725917 [Anopheles nili]|uniref:uncharacterized protein LOC128725917 n=1 Tax=Anopheles nili TaxID=185578 RepID=UPI00237AAB4A|nr:uncharacterized protein LOC128725917 [Anopheles nili]
MAAFLRRRTKETQTSKYASELQGTDTNVPSTISNNHESAELAEDRTRYLQNPAILDTLDSVHRSLLFSNLKFDTDDTSGLQKNTAPDGRSRQKQDFLAPSVSTAATRETPASQQIDTLQPHYWKVNIAAASSDERLTKEGDVSQVVERIKGVTPKAPATDRDASLNDELEALFGKDWNNNLNRRNSSRVKMMVQQYEHGEVATSHPSRPTHQTGETRQYMESHPDSPSVCDVETSDFESASVTSGSSVCGNGGRRSVRTSSAFSEGSRDMVSIDRFELEEAMAKELGFQEQQQHHSEESSGHNTLITININYRCDNNPLRNSKTEERAEKSVDIVVSTPPQGVDFQSNTVAERKSLKNDNPGQLAMERQVHRLDARNTHTAVNKRVDKELMNLGNEKVLSVEGDTENYENHMDEGENKNKTERRSKDHRSSFTSSRTCQTPEMEEYHDCNDLHESTLSFYEQATSQPVTPQEKKKRSSRVHDSSGSTVESIEECNDGEKPMIRIVQELTEDHREVTSTITLNKAQITEMQKKNGERRSVEPVVEKENIYSPDEKTSPTEDSQRRRKSHFASSKKRHVKTNHQRQQRIIDDNFCNEILDSTIHFDRLYGINRIQRHMTEEETVSSSSPIPVAEECFSDSVICDIVSPGEESFDSVLSVGKLEGKPRYSGKTMGRLMMKRLKKLHGGTEIQKPSNASDTSTNSSLLQTSGPKKPPRTFANSPKRESPLPVPSCPARKDIDDSDPSDKGIGWKREIRTKTHRVGWTVPAANDKNASIPAEVYSMLHYSEDESRKKLIKVGNSKPAPQQSSSQVASDKREPLGPKLVIDTVDGPRTPRRHSSSTDFERFVRDSNVKSTPHRRSDVSNRVGNGTRADTRRMIEQFLSDERSHGPEALRKLSGPDRRRRTTGGIFERRRQQQENFLDDARRTNHEPRRRKISKAVVHSTLAGNECCPKAVAVSGTTSRTNGNVSSGGKIEKRRAFRKVSLLKRTRTLFEASKKKIFAIKKFETPKKLNAVSTASLCEPQCNDPNINRNSSMKKKNSLHHKHLGYTPVHLRCKSCRSEVVDIEREDEIVPLNFRSVTSKPKPKGPADSSDEENKENYNGSAAHNQGTDKRRRSGEGTNRKSVRSLNFAQLMPQSKPVESSDAEISPRKQLNEIKFLKTLRNLKISPKRILRFASQSSTAGNGQISPTTSSGAQKHGEFQSYDDLNLDNVANMGDFLSNIRCKIEGEEFNNLTVNPSPSSVAVDVHGGQGEPIYQEISPKGNKTILNEFISSDTNKRYLMVNNNPNILYAMVESKSTRCPAPLVKARSLTSIHGTSGIVDPTVTSTPVSKPQNNTCKSQTKPSIRRTLPKAIVGREEQPSSLYNTALAENSHCSQGASHAGQFSGSCGDGGGGSDRVRASFNTTESTAASTTRRSLFSRDSSLRLTGPDRVRETTDDSDISVLQEEESGEDEVSQQSRPDTAIVEEPLIVREWVEDRLNARKESERFQQKPPSPGVDWGFKGPYKNEKELFAFEQDIIVEERVMGNSNRHGVSSEGRLDHLKNSQKSVQARVGGKGVAPLGCFDTDSELESLRKYQDNEIDDLVHSLNNNITLSDIGTLDTTSTVASTSMENLLDQEGYDTVDLAPSVTRVFHKPVERNLTVDTVDVSELISQAPDDSLSASYFSPNTSTPSSSKLSSTGTAVMRNLKDKLRTSFRKSKSFIKKKRQRIANYLQEDRPASKSSSTNSSCANSPPRSAVSTQTPHRQDGRSPDRRKAENEQDMSDDMYRSFTEGSNSIITTSSMMELSNQHMNELMQQIIRQGDARKQLKQAVAICRSTREFECSPELIEAERLLLVATHKETTVRNELNKIDYLSNGMTLAEGKRVGTVTLSNFEFPLKETAIRDTLYNYFYVVVCTHKHEVKATVAKERHSNGRVYIRDCAIQFQNLDANYEIRVEVFVLQLRKNVKNYSFESRYHLDKDTKRPLSCPSPSKKLREAGRMLSFRSSPTKTFDFDNEFSRFKSQGFLTLTFFTLLTSSMGEDEDEACPEEKQDATYVTARTSHNTHTTTMLEDESDTGSPLGTGDRLFSRPDHFHPIACRREDQSVVFIAEDFKYLTLDSMAYTSNMVGTIGMNVRSEVRFEGSNMSGFLDVGEKMDDNEGITWNRRWCKINGFMLEFWNYPQECQEKIPILYIDLVKCINDRIGLADRSICSRPRTLKVEIFASRVAASAASCNSSGIGSFKSTGRTTSPNSVGETAGCSSESRGLLRPSSPNEQCRTANNVNVTCYFFAADTQSDLKGWLNELNRVVKFLKEWKM